MNVLITGASQGLGYEFVKLFAIENNTLILVARNEEKLQTIAKEVKEKYGCTVAIIAQDLTAVDAAEKIVSQLTKKKLSVDVLVNNAGFATFGLFADSSIDEDANQIFVNILAVTKLTKLIVDQMLIKKQGKILMIASTAAFQPGPLMAVYYATKSFVLSFSEALANELQNTGITVTVLCPGPTRTGFAKKADIQNSFLFTNFAMDAEVVAKAGYDGLMQKKTIVIPGFINNLFVQSLRISPRSLVPQIVRMLQKKR